MIALSDRKLRVRKPRLRRKGGGEVEVPAYAQLQQRKGLARQMLKILLGGISTRRYREVLPRMAKAVPYLGYILTDGRWFAQGFGSLGVPTDSALPTLMYIDNAIGYYVYRSNNLRQLVTAVSPTFETHLNIPLNHRGYNNSDPFGLAYVSGLRRLDFKPNRGTGFQPVLAGQYDKRTHF